MANNIQYYLNQGEPCNETADKGCCLKKGNYLSEFETEVDKEMAVNNLGIPDIVNNIVDSKIESIIGEVSRIWEEFTKLTGETYNNIIFTVTPEYYIGEIGCDVHILANSGIFEELQLYINGELISSNRNIGHLEQTVHINGTSIITCKAKLDGIWHTISRTITHYDSFWMGAGQSYSDVMTNNNLKPIVASNYDINFGQDNNLIVIVGGHLSSQDNSFPILLLNKGIDGFGMGGMRIPLHWSEIIIDELPYSIGISDYTYNGTNNIYIATP